MEFFVDRDNIERKYKEIYKIIFKMRNGETHEEMTKLGLTYTKSFGVNIVCLKDLACKYEKNHLLANKLWTSELREAKIIASMLEDVEVIDDIQLERWIIEAGTNEILEQLCMNLYVYYKNIQTKLTEWIVSDDINKQKISLLLIARLSLLKKNNDKLDFVFDDKLLPPTSLCVNDIYVEKMCVRAFVRLAALSNDGKIKVDEFFKSRAIQDAKWSFVSSEIKQELNYL